jgi:hypothetical protein
VAVPAAGVRQRNERMVGEVYPSEGRADGGVLNGVPDEQVDAPGDSVEAAGDSMDDPAMDAPDVDTPDVDTPEPIEVPEPPVTGDPLVDEAVRRIAAAVRHPLEDQVPVYDAVHRGLQDRLADVED